MRNIMLVIAKRFRAQVLIKYLHNRSVNLAFIVFPNLQVDSDQISIASALLSFVSTIFYQLFCPQSNRFPADPQIELVHRKRCPFQLNKKKTWRHHRVEKQLIQGYSTTSLTTSRRQGKNATLRWFWTERVVSSEEALPRTGAGELEIAM